MVRLSPSTDLSGGRRAKRGFSLIEGLLASVVLAVAVVAVCGVLAASVAHEGAAREQAVGASLGRQLMEEISSKPFVVPPNLPPGSPGDGTSREHFHTIGDYDGYSDVSSGIRTLGGMMIEAGGGGAYTRGVSVEYRLTPSGAAAPAGDFALVTVTVEGPSGQTVTLQQLITNVKYER